MRRDVSVQADVSLLNISEYVHHVVLSEGRLEVEHFVEQYPQAPNIHVLLVTLALVDFRGHILPRSAKSDSPFPILKWHSPAEVAQFYSQLFGQQDVLRLYVPVDDALRMYELDHFAHLEKDLEYLHFAHGLFGLHILVEVAAAGVLHDQNVVAFLFNEPDEENYVLVLQVVVNDYFLAKLGLVLLIVHVSLEEKFSGVGLPGVFVRAQKDSGIGSLPQLPVCHKIVVFIIQSAYPFQNFLHYQVSTFKEL